MIKKDAAVVQDMYSELEVMISEERRTILARRGRVLYGKYCGLKGHGICAESFAEYHIWRGELIVARDLLDFLNAEIIVLQRTAADDPAAAEQLEITGGLIERISLLLGEKTLAETTT